jgi:hypothetical protein
MNMISDKEEFLTECHALWTRHDASMPPLERQLDEVLQGYLFYPEFEWPMYNVRPPDNHPLVASWRTADGDAFIFLLEVYQPKQDEPNYLVILAGYKDEIQAVNSLIGAHKLNFTKIEKKQLAKASAGKGLEDETKNKSIERFSKVIGVFALIINAFSLYLRELPSPENINDLFKTAYASLVMIVHFSALLLLLLIVIVSIVYTARYGYMMLRRMQ